LYGKFTFLGAYNHITRLNVQLVAGRGWTNFLGRFQNAASPFSPGSIPWNKAYSQMQWDYHGFSWVNTFNYVGDYHDFGADVTGSSLVIGPRGPPDPANIAYTRNRRVKAWITFDTQLSYIFNMPGSSKDWRHWLDRTSIRIGINNIFDEPPPFVAGAPTGDNYDTSLATLRGRYYYVGLDKKF
jgi:outer membrane receptor protein involved in Fe transport